MRVYELLDWVNKAQAVHQMHQEVELRDGVAPPSDEYALLKLSLERTIPQNIPVTQAENEIALRLMRDAWNEVQDWVKQNNVINQPTSPFSSH